MDHNMRISGTDPSSVILRVNFQLSPLLDPWHFEYIELAHAELGYGVYDYGWYLAKLYVDFNREN